MSGDAEPCVKFRLRSNLERKKPSSDDHALQDAYDKGALRPGFKLLYLTACDARQLYNTLRAHKEKGDPCMQGIELRETGADREDESIGREDVSAALGMLSLRAGTVDMPPTPPSYRYRCRYSEMTSASVAMTASAATVTELLIFACSPRGSELNDAGAEAADVAIRTYWGDGVHIFWGGDVERLRAYLAEHPRTKRFLFIGHANAPTSDPAADAGAGAVDSPPLETTLAFTTASGELEIIEPKMVTEIIGRHAVCNGGSLELVMLNGCDSYAMGAAV